ncbi:hypothetical protein BESB_060960 [Besnoitia besnoiti]|uniref:Transmembrane protein n=1 Tax=Besnoitia besnoiti TaxID=94643 RepID=A0A2A9MBF4_BESBE|nr:hypothetical protein BESB_060960 [Besnoitia besnoiti]PFH35209.1 hypothetical protein BESB_060960 [Besnoitia besnoiti]
MATNMSSEGSWLEHASQTASPVAAPPAGAHLASAEALEEARSGGVAVGEGAVDGGEPLTPCAEAPSSPSGGGCRGSVMKIEHKWTQVLGEEAAAAAAPLSPPLPAACGSVADCVGDAAARGSGCRPCSEAASQVAPMRPVRLCEQLGYEVRQICRGRCFDFSLRWHDWRQVFGCSRFELLDPLTVLLLRLVLAVATIGISVWNNFLSPFPPAYFTSWTNFLAALHATVATVCSIVALHSMLRLARMRRASAHKTLAGAGAGEEGETESFTTQQVRERLGSVENAPWWKRLVSLRRRAREAYAALLSRPEICDGAERSHPACEPCWKASAQPAFESKTAEEKTGVRVALVHPAAHDSPQFAGNPSTVDQLSTDCSTLGKMLGGSPTEALLAYPGKAEEQAKEGGLGVEFVGCGEAHDEATCMVEDPGRECAAVVALETMEEAGAAVLSGGKGVRGGEEGKNVSLSFGKRLLYFFLFAVWDIATTATVVCIIVFWGVLVPCGQRVNTALDVLEHSVCLISALFITFTGRVPFLFYHLWVLFLVSLAYCAMSLVVYLVPLTVGDKTGYVYSVFNFPANPALAWPSFVFGLTVGGTAGAFIVWLVCWRVNLLFDPARRQAALRPRVRTPSAA